MYSNLYLFSLRCISDVFNNVIYFTNRNDNLMINKLIKNNIFYYILLTKYLSTFS